MPRRKYGQMKRVIILSIALITLSLVTGCTGLRCNIDETHLEQDKTTVAYITCTDSDPLNNRIIQEYGKTGMQICREKGYNTVDLYYKHPDANETVMDEGNSNEYAKNPEDPYHCTHQLPQYAFREYDKYYTDPQFGVTMLKTFREKYLSQPELLKCKVTCTNKEATEPYQMPIK